MRDRSRERSTKWTTGPGTIGNVGFKSFCTTKDVPDPTRRALGRMSVYQIRDERVTYRSPFVVSDFCWAVQVEPTTLSGGEHKINIIYIDTRIACLFHSDGHIWEDICFFEEMGDIASCTESILKVVLSIWIRHEERIEEKWKEWTTGAVSALHSYRSYTSWRVEIVVNLKSWHELRAYNRVPPQKKTYHLWEVDDGRLVVASESTFQPLLLPFTEFFDIFGLFVARLGRIVQRQLQTGTLDLVVHSKRLLPFSAMFSDTKIRLLYCGQNWLVRMHMNWWYKVLVCHDIVWRDGFGHPGTRMSESIPRNAVYGSQ